MIISLYKWSKMENNLKFMLILQIVVIMIFILTTLGVLFIHKVYTLLYAVEACVYISAGLWMGYIINKKIKWQKQK